MVDVSKELLVSLLKENVLYLKFKKVDGTIREANGTLKEGIVIPYQKKTTVVKEFNDNIIHYWDTDKNEWRSFKHENFIGFGFTHP